MKFDRRSVLLLPLFLSVAANARDNQEQTTVRWDIVLVSGGIVRAGGPASALNNNGFKITVTGSGTFVPEEPGEVTGGGNFTIFDPRGTVVRSGTYRVTQLVSFDVAPGTLGPPARDLIGRLEDIRAGLAVLRIRYSDGNRGILVVSCHLTGTPDTVFEGITASHGFSDFWNRVAPSDSPFIDANRTAFHIVGEVEEEG